MRLPKFIRWLRFKSKIFRQLPDYHPETGERLYWKIGIVKSGRSGYDIQTGKPLSKGMAHLMIDPKWGPGARTVYHFNIKAWQIIKEDLSSQWGG